MLRNFALDRKVEIKMYSVYDRRFFEWYSSLIELLASPPSHKTFVVKLKSHCRILKRHLIIVISTDMKIYKLTSLFVGFLPNFIQLDGAHR